jgi:competence protein ComEC
MSYAQLEVTGHHETLIDTIRRNFTAGMQSALPEPLASFGMGLLIGQRATLPDSVYQDLLMVGLVHIIAVSGYNLTILLEASRRLLGNRSKRQVAFLSIALVGIFLLFTGSSASIVRAAIISLLSIAAAYYGRTFKPLVLIAIAAAITAYANPFYVWTNASWYLSFLAFFGVLVLAPLVRDRFLSTRWQNSLILMVALESLCAEIMTLPYVLHMFGQMSFVALIANMLVVALTPLAMLLSFVAGLAGMFIAPIAGWLAWPAVWLLTYMLDVAHLLSRIPHIFVQNIGFPMPQLLLLYLVVGLIIFVLWHKTKRLKSATITDNERT